MLKKLLRKGTVPPFISTILEKRLKRKIASCALISDDGELRSYLIRTSKGYSETYISTNEKRLKTQQAVLSLCRKHAIPVAKASLDDTVEHDDQEYLVSLHDIKGEPIATRGLHIFDYNRVLTNLADVLLKIHAIKLSEFGLLDSHLKGTRGSWRAFIEDGVEEQLRTLRKEKLLSLATVKILKRRLTFSQPSISPLLLHGHLSTKAIYIDSRLRISTLSYFTQPLSGDPNYDMAGFLLSEGFDRAKRLIKAYYLLGGFVEWDSEEFLKTSLRRAVGSLYWGVMHRAGVNPSAQAVIAAFASPRRSPRF